MNTENIKGTQALVKAFQTAGIQKIFTLSGNHIMPVYDAIFDSSIDLIHTRHEAAAVHMADAWARLTGEVGIALVTGGPGHANAVSALYTAAMAESPVVLLSGHAPLGQLGKGAFQEMHQADIAAPLTKASWVCQQTAILSKLKQFSKPVLLTGPLMQSQTGRVQLRALEKALGIPVIGMESPRGIGDPCLGAFAEVLNQADCVFLLGKKLDFTLKFGQSPGIGKDCVFLQVDPEEMEIDRVRRAVGKRQLETLCCDVPYAIEKILELGQGNLASDSAWQQNVAEAIRFRPDAWSILQTSTDRLHPVHAFAPVQAILDSHPDSVLISDGGEIGQWAQACLSAPNRIINGVAGSIGAGLPFAVAASIAKPDTPVIAVMGDGTFGFHCAELDTAIRHRLAFTLLVGNDARWNAEYQIQVRDFGLARTIGCELLPSRYEKVCEAFGGHGEMVTDASEVLPAVQRAIASRLPACFNILIDGQPAPNIQRD